MKTTSNPNIDFLLKDERNCRSNNLKAFFRSHRGKRMTPRLDVIRFEGQLWFATLGWLVRGGTENGFAGVRVMEVACQGAKAETGFPDWQKGGDYEIVTEWFWNLYRQQGIVRIPEIWHISIPQQLTHAESHTL